jgi:hypothetical protein
MRYSVFQGHTRAGLFLLALLITIGKAEAQRGGRGGMRIGSWNILQVQATLNDRWNMLVEGQIRSLGFYSQFHYYELKTALGYNLSRTAQVMMGAGTFNTYSNGDLFGSTPSLSEWRSWEELNLKSFEGRMRIDHRYRFEQRFLINGGDILLRHRFRYRIGLTLPLDAKVGREKYNFISGWVEPFLTNRSPYFERLRSYIGFGQRTREYTFQLGYLYQFDNNLSDEIGRSFMMFSMQFSVGKLFERGQDQVIQE